jgi:hypothetical protein
MCRHARGMVTGPPSRIVGLACEDCVAAALTAYAEPLRAENEQLREAVDAIRAATERWRYQAGRCPACHQSPHKADCFVVEVITIIVEAKMAARGSD